MGKLQNTGWTVASAVGSDIKVEILAGQLRVEQGEDLLSMEFDDVPQLIEALTLASQSQRAVDDE